MNQERYANLVRLLAAAGIGAVTVQLTWLFGAPGNGEFLVVAGIGGLVVALAAPGRAGYLVLLGSVAVTTWVQALLGGGALVVLVVGALWLPATVGWLVGYAALRIRRLGLRVALTDRRTLGALLGLVLIVATIAYFTISFATSPP